MDNKGMLAKCVYDENNQCALLRSVNVIIQTNRSWCKDKCKTNDITAQRKMLKEFMIKISLPPKDIDLLEWVKKCIRNDTIRLRSNEQERQRLLSEMPKGFKLAKNLLRHLKQIYAHYQETGRVKIEEDWRQARIAVCDRCQKMVTDDDGTRRCTVKTCGCYLDNPAARPFLGGKAEYEALTCDDRHWTVVDFEYGEKYRVGR